MKVYSPRIHNLGDFIHCLPVLSGMYKETGPISFGICDRLKRFNGIKDLLLQQEIFSDVHFMDELPICKEYIILDDTGNDENEGYEPLAVRRCYNFVKKHYPNIHFKLDCDFILNVPRYDDTHYDLDKILVGDRWSPKEAPDVDERRLSNNIKSYEKFNNHRFSYLDFSNDLLYNLSLIKFNPFPFITTFTGIGILSDMMNKETHILWDDDLHNWDNKPIEFSFNLHYYKNRKSKLHYIKEFEI